MSSSRVQVLIDDKEHGFEIHRLPSNRLVAIVHAVRDTQNGIALMVSPSGKIYGAGLGMGRVWSWRHGTSEKVARLLASLGVITTEQVDSHVAAVAARRASESASCDLEMLERYAKEHGVTLSGDGLDKLRAAAGKHAEDE